MAVRGRSLWVFNAACTVALFVSPALPSPNLSTVAIVQVISSPVQSLGARNGSFGSDPLVVLTHSLRAADTSRRDRPNQEPLHLAALAALALALPAVMRASLRVSRANHGHLYWIPFCGHGPPASASAQ